MFKLQIILLIVSVFLGGGLYWHYTHTMAENKQLKADLRAASASIGALNELANSRAEHRLKEEDSINEIDKDKSGDAFTAPVLRNAIGRLHSGSEGI